ncbi:MAG: ABC transporter ATP-binding protein [Limnochordia bacterium]|jgi:branched-chain amino acid transport system ATP-binding protein|nr:ABC transporter ATP-binding protein [Limnochordia bacterium]MDI9466130.1 ABC transporter ATP-binding protein [Bacillota bacterium]HOB41085.1 ABC transporter ATP-binding protein [Limnochordia bacterium]HOQ74482.1 ABC transporter ATP-binding protein [Limnochordia bacterium]HPZ80566.1 ABC transporter ATP-binding protein [Limnochordia bacterium]
MLAVENLTVHYGVIQALKGISFEVHEGEIFTLLGSNGAGKTTTLKALSGLLPKTSGRVLFAGRDITSVPSHALPGLGLVHVPEGRRIFAGLSVADNLLLGAYSRRDKAGIKEDLEAVFELFPRLAERRKQDAGSLSGGEQQMLAMGRGLMGRPKLLLLDEPSMGLAPILVEEIFAFIKEINRRGTTILLVEQNAQLALAISHKACVLETGSIALAGSAREVASDGRIQEIYLGVG